MPGSEYAALVSAARDARARAIAPFSRFHVGAAIATPTGAIIAAGNIESASYGLTMCAERVALLKALSDGWRVFAAIAVVADTDQPTAPCGACRQLLWEYGGDLRVILANLETITVEHTLSQLLPLPFDSRRLPDR